jgi:hypothetical protein
MQLPSGEDFAFDTFTSIPYLRTGDKGARRKRDPPRPPGGSMSIEEGSENIFGGAYRVLKSMSDEGMQTQMLRGDSLAPERSYVLS